MHFSLKATAGDVEDIGMVFVHAYHQMLFMEFIPLEKETQLEEIKGIDGYTVIFKHNTTCPISKSVRRHFEAEANQLNGISSVYFLDLLEHRNISDAIADQFGVPHESPQLLLIKNGQCTYNESLYDISVEATSRAINNS